MFTLCILLLFYFLPTVLASHRGHGIGVLFVLNLLFGWTGIGWLALLLYAVLAAPRFCYAAPVPPGYHYGNWQRF